MLINRAGQASLLALLILLGGAFQASAQAPQLVPVNDLVSLELSGLRYNRSTATYDTSVRVINTSRRAVFTPLRIAIRNISPASVILANPSSVAGGVYFVDIPAPGASFGPGATVNNIVLKFKNSPNGRFTFARSVEGQRLLVRAPAPSPAALAGNAPPADVQVGVQAYGGGAAGLGEITLEVKHPVTALVTPFVLRDNGEAGDRVARDGIYSATVPFDTTGVARDQCFTLVAKALSEGRLTASAATPLCVSNFNVGARTGEGTTDFTTADGDTIQVVANQVTAVFPLNTPEERIEAAADNAASQLPVDGLTATVTGFVPELQLHQIQFNRPLTGAQIAAALRSLLAGNSTASIPPALQADPVALLDFNGEPRENPDDLVPPPPGTSGAALGDYQWALDKVGAPEAWRLVKSEDRRDASGNPVPLTIAVIDSGVNFGHEDLAGNAGPRFKCIGPCAADADAQADPVGHGTAVSGVAGASTSNATGITGASWGARLMSIKVWNVATNSVSVTDVYNAIVKARAEQARVINVSLGKNIRLLCTNLAPVLADTVIVAAAGNNSSATLPFYPADCPGVISVANSTAEDVLNFTSNFTPQVDLAAPGTQVRTTVLEGTCTYCGGNSGQYRGLSGTSFASPLVAGAAALMLTGNDTLSPADVLGKMRATGIPVRQRYTTAANSLPAVASLLTPIPRLDACAAVLFSANTPVRFDNGGGKIAENPVLDTLAGALVPSCDNVTYSLTDTGSAEGRFRIVQSGTGSATRQEIRYSGQVGSIDYETLSTPDKTYSVTVRAQSKTNAALVATQTLKIEVLDVNEPPKFTSPATISVPENTVAVLTLAATDEDRPLPDRLPQTIGFSIAGGPDAALFELAGPGLDQLRFRSAPDFEKPAHPDNVYEVHVQASDGQDGGEMTQVVRVTVTDVPEARFDIAAASGLEGTSLKFTVTRSVDTTLAQTVDYAAATGTADTADFTLAPGTLSFGPGEITKTITVDTVADDLTEGTETFTVTISNPQGGAAIGAASAVGTITESGPID